MYTYFIYDKKTRLLKIGKSKNPFNRLTVLSTSNGNLMLIYFSDLITEKDAHIFFKENRIFGEWYNIRPLQLFDYIGQKVVIPRSFWHKKDWSYANKKTEKLAGIINNNADYFISDYDYYRFTHDLYHCYNLKIGKKLQMQVKGYTKGYYLSGKFYSLIQLRKLLMKIEKIDCPF